MACEAPGLLGGLLGNERRVIGWFRDAQCVPPAWPMPKVRDRVVTLSGVSGRWEVEYVDPVTGRVIRNALVTATRGRLKMRLPLFEGSIAMRLVRRDSGRQAAAAAALGTDRSPGGGNNPLRPSDVILVT